MSASSGNETRAFRIARALRWIHNNWLGPAGVIAVLMIALFGWPAVGALLFLLGFMYLPGTPR